MRTLTATIVLLTLAGCNVSANIEEAKRATDTFHQRLRTLEYAAIYRDATAEFQQQAKEPEFFRMLSAVDKKLGTLEQAEVAGWHVNTTTQGTFVTLTYRVKFANGQGTESFVWRTGGDQPKLYAYNVNSPALLIN